MTECLEVVAGLIWRDSKILMCLRPEHKIMGGFWEFPGGKIEPGENIAYALRRELQEELGITARDITELTTTEHFYARENLAVRLHFLNVGAIGGEPVPREGQQMAWLEPEAALKLQILPADVVVLRRFAPL